MLAGRKTRARRALERTRVDFETLRHARRAQIRRARELGMTWSEIGDALGMSPSGASSLVRPKIETKTPSVPTVDEQRDNLEQRLEKLG
jgi:DNA-binding transcriptional MerR regulator